MTHVLSDGAGSVAGQRKQHLPALDGLRGLAILGVLLFHTGLLAGGFLGVDLFFALSGYLITGLLSREVSATGGVSLVAFWGRRIRRLLPASALLLVVVSVLVTAFGTADLRRTTLSDGPWVQANLVNWHLLAESADYWDRFGSSRVFEHLWSIAVEEQFYLVWPVVVVILARWGQRWVAFAAATGSVVSLVLMVVLVDPADPTRVYTGTDTRAFSLLLGAFVATRPVGDWLGRVVGRWVVPAARGRDGRRLGVRRRHRFVVAVSRWVVRAFRRRRGRAVRRAPDGVVGHVLAWRPLRWLGFCLLQPLSVALARVSCCSDPDGRRSRLSCRSSAWPSCRSTVSRTRSGSGPGGRGDGAGWWRSSP